MGVNKTFGWGKRTLARTHAHTRGKSKAVIHYIYIWLTEQHHTDNIWQIASGV